MTINFSSPAVLANAEAFTPEFEERERLMKIEAIRPEVERTMSIFGLSENEAAEFMAESAENAIAENQRILAGLRALADEHALTDKWTEACWDATH